MDFKNNDSDDDSPNIKVNIGKKRKRQGESILSNELNVVYNLYQFMIEFISAENMTLQECKEFMEVFQKEITVIKTGKNKQNNMFKDILLRFQHNTPKNKRAYKEKFKEMLSICENTLTQLIKDVKSKNLKLHGINRYLKNKMIAIESMDEDPDYVQESTDSSYSSNDYDNTSSDNDSSSNNDSNDDNEDMRKSISIEDQEFLKYLYNKQSTGTKKDFNYFKDLDKVDKTKLLNLLETIQIKNNVHKPYLFRALQSNMPMEVKAEVVRKVEMANSDGSSEDNQKLTSWIDALLKIQFGNIKETSITNKSGKKVIHKHFKDALDIMDESIYGHNQAKNVILQIIAHNFTNPHGNSTVIGIQGPMGNGKTTLIEKGVAKVLDRPFCHISLGGAKDSSYLDGHDYTYIGSKWGKIADVLMKAKCMNPIIYFDELDKVSRSEKGDEIINVLMHLIDTSQNSHFEDKYFTGVEFDLSKATFIFSYNDNSLVSPILMDRITEIETSGFKTDEKIEIAEQYLQPNIMKDIGFNSTDISYTNEVYRHIIENYTVEGGVRKLKEILYQVAREINLRKLMNKKINNAKMKLPIVITKDIIDKDILKKYHKVIHTKISDKASIGKICGLYATTNHTGGITIIEVKPIPTKQKLALELTGSQGKVMRESMSVAKTVAWNIIPQDEKDRLNKEWYDGYSGFHIHCPDGSTEKDGPSAGLAITTALISSITGIKIKRDVAVTGEIDLDGSALAIGGLVHKLYGAKRAGITLAMCPIENKSSIERIKKEYSDLIDDDFKVIMVNNIWEVLENALEDNKIKFITNHGKHEENTRIRRNTRMMITR
jgi:endopeptidase La